MGRANLHVAEEGAEMKGFRNVLVCDICALLWPNAAADDAGKTTLEPNENFLLDILDMIFMGRIIYWRIFYNCIDSPKVLRNHF